MTARILVGDMRQRLRELSDDSVDSVVCDPPYHLTTIANRWHGANEQRENFMREHVAVSPHSRVARGFMGQEWDGGDVAFDPATWAEVLRVLKPGGHLIAFSGTRTYHRMTVAIEDAGFEVRDMIAWHYGSGFLKSLDIGKAIDKAQGVAGTFGEAKTAAHQGWIDRGRMRGADGHEGYQRPWMNDEEAVSNNARRYIPAAAEAQTFAGYGTALKPATEPMCLARKPLSEKSVAANVLKWGTGALNIDGCRIGTDERTFVSKGIKPGSHNIVGSGWDENNGAKTVEGRWPANLCHDGSDEVVAGFPVSEGGHHPAARGKGGIGNDGHTGQGGLGERFDDEGGSAARFFYCAKADSGERGSKCKICNAIAANEADACACTECELCGTTAPCSCIDPETKKPRRKPKRLSHPTVKPQALMQWLVRLVTPAGGTVLDPFMGSGSTGVAAQAEQCAFIGCELSPDYAAIAETRLRKDAGLFALVELSPDPAPPPAEQAA